MTKAKFKVGDRVKPSKKDVSNYWNLSNIDELEVTNEDINQSWSKNV